MASLTRPVAARPRRKQTAHALLLTAALAANLIAPVKAHAQGMAFIRDTEIEEMLHKWCDPVFETAGLNAKKVKIDLVQDRMNAFAVSGQEVGITTDLILETDNPNQVVGVMAHEAGHAAGGHPLRSGEMMRAGMMPMLLTLGLGILAAAAGAPDAAAGLLSSANYFGALGALTYSREQESRADQAALTYLERSGLSGRGLVEFFDAFRYEEVFSEARRFPYFQSHPISSERIENLRRRAEDQKHYNVVDSPEALAEHAIMKAKLLAFTQPAQQTFIRFKETDTSFPARYARAIAYYRATDTERALRLIDGLLADYPTNPYLWELKGQVLFEAGRAKEAEPAHRRAVELKPDAPLLRLLLAQAILGQAEDGKPAEIAARAESALVELRKAAAQENDNALIYRLMGQAYDAKGEPGEARLAAAEERFSIGDKTQARIFAMRARELLIKDTPQWRRATDIVLVSNPSDDDLKAMSRG